MPNNLPTDLQRALDQLLSGAVALTQEAERAMPESEAAALDAAIAGGRTQYAVSIILPSGAVRVGLTGEWLGSKTLWELIPLASVLERKVS